MNVTASKLLLGISLAAYTYASWDHLFTSQDKPAPPAKGKELTKAMVTRFIPLEIAADPFDSVPLERGAVASGSIQGDSGKSLGQLTLQAIFLTPMERIAMINGKPVREGQVVQLEAGGAAIHAKKVAEDYVVLESGGNLMMLRIEDKNDKSNSAAARNESPRNGSRTASVRPNER